MCSHTKVIDDRTQRLIWEVEGLINSRDSNPSSALLAAKIVNIVTATVKGEREPESNPKPWGVDFAIQPQEVSDCPKSDNGMHGWVIDDSGTVPLQRCVHCKTTIPF